MSKEALHKTKVEYKKQEKEMKDIDLAISKLENLRDKDQKILNSKKTRKVELEAKITQNTNDQKKALPQAEHDALVNEKRELDRELIEIVRDINIYTGTVDDYNDKIQEQKKRKDEVTPQLASAKKENLGERVGHFMKKNWAALAASTILAGAVAGGYEYGKRSSSNESKAPVDKVAGIDTTSKKDAEDPKLDTVKKKASDTTEVDNNNKNLDKTENSNKKLDKKNKVDRTTAKYADGIIKQNYKLDPSHGDLSQKTENKKAEVESNVFNSFVSLQTAIQKEGKDNLFYSPHQIGSESPYWSRKQGTEIINNQQDYINHVNQDLIPQGFSGKTFSNIQHFGFKLNKNEFISDSKYDVIVKAGVIGGEAYVLLKKGTAVVFERQFDSQGRLCNVLAYILDCMNPIYANDPHTNVDGSGGFKL